MITNYNLIYSSKTFEMKLNFISVLALSVFLSSCIDDVYLDAPLSDTVPLTPGLILPLASVKTDVSKLISKATNKVEFYRDDNGKNRVMVYLEEDSVKQFGLNDLFSMPPASITVPVNFQNLNSGSVSISDSVAFLLSNASLDVVTSEINYSIQATNIAYPVNLVITLKDVSTAAQKPVVISQTLAAGQSTNLGAILNATSKFKNNKFAISISLSKVNSSNVSSAVGSISLISTISNFTYVKGSLKETSLTINEDVYDINMGVFKQEPGVVRFANPSLYLTSINSSPFAAKLSPLLAGEDTTSGNMVTLTPLNFPINKRIDFDTASKDSLAYTNSNSNIDDFLNISPNKLHYSGNAVINPAGSVNSVVEMYENDAIYLGYRINYPLEFTVNDLTTSDTLDLGGTGLTEKVEAAMLTIVSINKFPFTAKTVLKLRDDLNTTIDTINLQLIEGAEVDVNGYVITENVEPYYEVHSLEGQRLINFRNATSIVLETSLFTTDFDKNKIVVIEKENSLSIQLGLRAQVNTEL